MQKKKDKLLDKIVKKDYNNELEKVLERKYFSENVKSLLLSIMYKIETAYRDYEKVKPDVEEKDEFIKGMIDNIQNNCEDIKIIQPNSKESQLLGEKTFQVNNKKKKIICYPIERKLCYCLAKINKNEKIVKDKYYVIDRTLSDLINVGNNIDTVEPMRDFNGYSWTTIPREIESINHNLVYQNIRILVGNKFLKNWIKNDEFIIDYFDSFQNRLEKYYGEEQKDKLTEILTKLSVLLAVRYNPKIKKELEYERKQVEEKLFEMKDNQTFIQKITDQKRKITNQIKEIDETMNSKSRLQKEYEKRNEILPLEEKIFSIRILYKIMISEREEKIKKIEELNTILNPQKFVNYKKELEAKEKYLKLTKDKNLDKTIKESMIELQIEFLKCYQNKIKRVETKQDSINLLYEFRYYCLLPFNESETVGKLKELEKEIQEVEKQLLEKAHKFKIIDIVASSKEIDYEILKNIFYVRVINLEDLFIKVTKEKEDFYLQLLDENVFEEKIKLGTINKKELEIKINKKVKIFN